MSEDKQACDTCEHFSECNSEQAMARRDSGIGGGIAGAAIGGLLGHRVGGVFGAVVGATAGGLVGNGTAVNVNRAVESLENAAGSVSETVNDNVNSVGTALKDTIQEVKPFMGTANTVAQGVNYSVCNVNSVVDTLRSTVDDVKPSVVGTANTVAQGVNDSINSFNSIVNAVKDTVDEVKPSVVNVFNTVKDTLQEIKNANSDEIIEDVENSELLKTQEQPQQEIQSTVTPISPEDYRLKNRRDAEGTEKRDIEPEGSNTTEDAKNSELLKTQEQPQQKIQSVENTLQQIKKSDNSDRTIIEDAENSELLKIQEQPQQEIQSVENTLQQIEKSDNSDRTIIEDGENRELLKTQEQPQQEIQSTVTPIPPEDYQLKNRRDAAKSVGLGGFPHEQLFKREGTEKRDKQRSLIIQEESNTIEDVENSELLKTQEQPQQEIETNSQPQKSQFKIKAIPAIVGAAIGAVAFVSLGSITGFTPKKSLVLTASQITAPQPTADGWIFIGNINKNSLPDSGKSLVKGSQSTDSSVVPSVGELVTVSFEQGVTLRDNVPQKPNFSYKEQKALDILQPAEKLKILQLEFITPPQTNKPVTSVWAKVDRCGNDCKY